MRLCAVLAASVFLGLLSVVGAVDDLQSCIELDQAFDTRALLAPCTAAAEDATRSVPDRVTAFGILGAAHVVNGDEALGERAFLRMLALTPGATVRKDAGARVTAAFERARARLDTEGAVRRQVLTFERASSGDAALVLEVVDPLSRAVAADVIDDAPSAEPWPLVRTDLGRGVLRFAGRVPLSAASSTVTIHVRGWDGSAVLVEHASLPAVPPQAEAQTVEAAGLPVLPIVIIGCGALVAAGGALTAATIEAQLTDPGLSADARSTRQITGRGALVAAGLGVAAIAAGVVMWVALP